MRRRANPILLAILLICVPVACEPQRTDHAAGEVEERGAHALEAALGSASADVRRAAAALQAGHPWDATRLLHARVQGEAAAVAGDVVLILAAESAAAWGGWDEVARLLRAGGWRRGAHAGEGYALLARRALARNEAAAAAAFADSSLRMRTDARTRGMRLTLLARGLDRLGARDSAASAYGRAVRDLPAIGDWLRLRAAGVTANRRMRQTLYADVQTPAARERIRWTEAIALDLAGDREAAAALYDSLGGRAQALRLRVAAAPAAAPARATLRARAFAILDLPRSADEWRRTLAIVDSAFAPLTAAEELRIARSAARHGTAARTVRGFARAAEANLSFTDQDRYDHGIALTRLGRWRDAATRLARVDAASTLGGRAAYQRARALLRAGDGRAARTALRAVVTRHRDDPAAASALNLLADLATDEGRDAAARSAWRELVARHPRSDLASTAAFRAALVAYVAGDVRTAAQEWEAAARSWPNGDEALASRYWAGRARARAGDVEAARTRWREVMERSTTSYYAMLAARRLGVPVWQPAAAGDTPPSVPHVDSAIARMALLDSLGLDVEEGHERAALIERVDKDRYVMLAAGAALRSIGRTSPAITLGHRAAGAGARDARTYRLIYPLVHKEALVAAAKRNRLDPALVAGLIRQESSFNPGAVSPVGARGLMQLMPRVGRAIARTKAYPVWDEDLLFQPSVSFDLGTTHLAGDLSRHSSLVRALAAYNAGASRVTRWSRKAGVADPEVFAERIPYAETRDYVRIVQRNVEFYRSLYGL